MSSPIRLTHFSLIGCDFRLDPPTTSSDEEPEAVADASETERVGPAKRTRLLPSVTAPEGAVDIELDLENVSLRYVDSEEDEYNLFLLIHAWVTDIKSPYHLEVVTASRFDASDPPVPVVRAASTLLFMTFPYVRETMMNLSARSPFPPLLISPLARLPHPSVTGESPPAEQDAGDAPTPATESEPNVE